MSFAKKSASALGKLFTVIVLAGTFIVGLVGVVYLSLQGEELKVPEIVGKDFVESERELASLGLRIKRRADRPSTDKPNTVLEQLPKAGDTVKTGQMILVVTSKASLEGEETPVNIKKNTEEDDSEKIEELISDKPKKNNKANTNVNANKKKASTARDVLSNNSNENSNASNSNSNSNKTNSNSGTNKNTATNTNKSNSNAAKTNSNKPATGGDVRPRRTPQP
jgi:beta-lactam-binding protein with PASTA domain